MTSASGDNDAAREMWRVEALISLIFISSIDTGLNVYTIISTVLSWEIQKGAFLRVYRFYLGRSYLLAAITQVDF